MMAWKWSNPKNKSRVTKKKGRGFGAETHADVTEYEALDGEGNASAAQRLLLNGFVHFGYFADDFDRISRVLALV
ncbi:unnamed protein product [Anisakis simplex]|uniref:DUF1338 domain-containing protein n=1 Tax=Anisakis simplex TaxID=6269 RepID=A0A0M3JN06_ANISI|nr:unnamed protein product [Anisakis simplex]